MVTWSKKPHFESWWLDKQNVLTCHHKFSVTGEKLTSDLWVLVFQVGGTSSTQLGPEKGENYNNVASCFISHSYRECKISQVRTVSTTFFVYLRWRIQLCDFK